MSGLEPSDLQPQPPAKRPRLARGGTRMRLGSRVASELSVSSTGLDSLTGSFQISTPASPAPPAEPSTSFLDTQAGPSFSHSVLGSGSSNLRSEDVDRYFKSLTRLDAMQHLVRIMQDNRIYLLDMAIKLVRADDDDTLARRSAWYRHDNDHIPRFLNEMMRDSSGEKKILQWLMETGLALRFTERAIHNEMEKVLDHTRLNSLAELTPDLIQNWNRKTVLDPLETLAPTLFSVLRAAAETDRARKINVKKSPTLVRIFLLLLVAYSEPFV
jgi:hypothetical protein